jgi:small GTP-binding protein
MFHLAQNFYNWVQVRREYRVSITVLGLNNAGKTSIVNCIRGASGSSVAPTMGFNKEDVELGNLKLTFFDLGGSPKIRNTWVNYFARAHGIIFVVDASDPNSFEECKKVLDEATAHALLASKPFLILANKNDVTGCVDALGIRSALGLSASASSVRVQGCSATSKPSIDEGTAWIFQAIVSQWSALSARVQADVSAEDQKLREAFAERKRQVELKKAQRLKDEEARLAAEALQAKSSEVPIRKNSIEPHFCFLLFNVSGSEQLVFCHFCMFSPQQLQETLQPSVAQAVPPNGSIESIKVACFQKR